jgi:hypothetical protein
VSIVIKKEESPIVVPLHISADEEIKVKSEACSLVYVTLALVLDQGHLAGSRPTVLAPPPSASLQSGEATRLTPPITRRLL